MTTPTNPSVLSVTDALAFAKTSGKPIAVVDSGYCIANNAHALAALGSQLVSVQENTGFFFSWPLAVADALVLAPKLTNGMGMPDTFTAITDTAANVAANAAKLLALGAQVAQGGITVVDSAAHVAAYAGQLAKLGGSLSVNLSDRGAAAIAANATALAKLGGQLYAGITDTAANLCANAAGLAKLGAALSLTVADTAANINANQAKLLGLGAALAGLSLPDGTALTVKDLDGKSLTLFSGDALAYVKAGLALPVRVADYGAYIANNADALASISGKLLSVKETSANTSFIWAVNAADAVALAPKLTNSLGNAETFSNVSDSAAHVLAQLDALAALGGRIGGITLTDKGTPRLAVTAAQAANDQSALNAISSPYVLSVKDSAANINSLSSALIKGAGSNGGPVLGGIHAAQVEVMPTSLAKVMTETATISTLNLSQINLAGCTINEKVYNGTGTELDIVAANGTVLSQMLFTHDTISQLHLLGIGSTPVHLL